MNEEELFRAYSSLRLTEEERIISEDRAKLGIQRLGYIKCWVPGCITLIAIGADRKICRYHIRKAVQSE